MTLNMPCDNAKAVWDANPLLSYAYGDFQEFEENFQNARGDALNRAFEWTKHRAINLEREHREARTRLQQASRPISSQMNMASVVRRHGGRLTLWVYGGLARSVMPLLEALNLHQDATGIILRLDSSGGFLDAAYELAGALASHPARKVAIVDRSCWSAAVLVATACDRIFIRSNATMMIHRCSRAAAGDADALLDAVVMCRQADSRYARFIASRRRAVGHTRFADLCNRSHYMSASEAVEFGFADRVIHPLPVVAVADTDVSRRLPVSYIPRINHVYEE